MKKLLSLILTLALMSTMLVLGGASASAAAATTTVTGEKSDATYITVTQNISTSAQTATSGIDVSAINSSHSGSAYRTVDGTNIRWHYMKFEIGEFESVSAATLTTKIKRTTASSLAFYPLTKEMWTAASTAIENGGTPSVTLAVPNTTYSDSDILDKVTVTKATTATETNPTDTCVLTGESQTNASIGTELVCATTGGGLVEYIDTAVKKGETSIYIAVAGLCSADNKKIYHLGTLLTLTGERAVEGGIGTKIIAEKTARIDLNGEGNIAHVVNGTEGNQYTEEGNYSVNNCVHSGTEYVKYLYLRADLSEFADKEVTEVKLNVNGRKYSNSFTLYACETKNDWNITTISFDNQPEKISGKQAEFTGFEGYSSYYDASADVTSFVDDLATDSMLSIMLELDCGTKTNANGCTIKNVGGSYEDETKAPHLVITYLDEIDTDTDGIPAGETFTFKGEIAVTGTPVMLLVGIYGENNALIDVVSSGVLTNGTNELKVDVDLANYPTATSIKGFFWNGTTLAPFMDPTPARVVAAA